jgi:surface protein
MFNFCNTPYLDLSGFDVSNVTSMSNMFYSCTSEINIDGWDTSKLTDANYMFSSFTNGGKYIDLSVLDFSNVTKTDNMFNSCNIDYVDIRNLNLNLSKIDKMPFNNVSGKILDLSNYDITGLKSTYQLCYFCGCPTVDLTNWKTTEVTDMRNTFYYCSNIEKIIMPDWDMTNTTNTSSFFYSCNKLNYIDLSRSNDTTIAKIAALVPAQKLDAYGQMIIPADSSQANIEALTAKYWKPVGPRIDITSCEIVTELDEIKPGETTKLYYDNPEPWYGNDNYVEYVSSDESVATIDQENKIITSTGVEGTTEIIARNKETQEVISEPKVFSVSETDNYPNVIKFRLDGSQNNTSYISINNTNVKLNTINYNSVSDIYTYDAGAPITKIQFNLLSEIIKLNTSSITSMANMFYGCRKLTSLDLSSFDTSNVTDMQQMFHGCDNLTSLDLSSFDTSNVTNMGYMFAGCNLVELNLNNFNTSNVTSMHYMFQNCDNLTSLDLSSFDASNVTSMTMMFSNCSSLTDFKAPKNINANIDISASTKLTHDSLMSIINNLVAATNYKVLALGPTNLAKLTDEEIAIATGKGWTVR